MDDEIQAVKEILIGASVESFGILHQIPTLVLVDGNGDEINLFMENCVISISPDLDKIFASLSKLERQLIMFSKTNLLKVADVIIDDMATLRLNFSDCTLSISASSEGETWQLSQKEFTGGKTIIAHSNGSFSMWI